MKKPLSSGRASWLVTALLAVTPNALATPLATALAPVASKYAIPACLYPDLIKKKGKLSFAELREFLEKHSEPPFAINSPEKLLPCLPEELRKNYTLVYKSESSQKDCVDAEHPRIILFSNDGRTMIGIPGNVPKAGCSGIEVVEFDDKTKKFTPSAIVFPDKHKTPPETGKPKYHADPNKTAEPESARCLRCHTSDFRPNWDSYPNWPGVYGSRDDTMDPKANPDEVALYKKFTDGNAKTALYSSLVPPPGGGAIGIEPYTDKVTNRGHPELRPNLRLSFAIVRRNAERVAEKMKAAPNFAKERLRMVGGLLGCEPVPAPKDKADFEAVKKEFLAGFLAMLERKAERLKEDSPKLYAFLDECCSLEDYQQGEHGNRGTKCKNRKKHDPENQLTCDSKGSPLYSLAAAKRAKSYGGDAYSGLGGLSGVPAVLNTLYFARKLGLDTSDWTPNKITSDFTAISIASPIFLDTIAQSFYQDAIDNAPGSKADELKKLLRVKPVCSDPKGYYGYSHVASIYGPETCEPMISREKVRRKKMYAGGPPENDYYDRYATANPAKDPTCKKLRELAADPELAKSGAPHCSEAQSATLPIEPKKSDEAGKVQGATLLDTYCVKCHPSSLKDRPYGDPIALKAKLDEPGGCKHRDAIVKAVNNGSMPMASKEPMKDSDKSALTDYVTKLGCKP